jgi:hypothetical protein
MTSRVTNGYTVSAIVLGKAVHLAGIPDDDKVPEADITRQTMSVGKH